MDETRKLSKSVIIIMGIMMTVMGGVAIITNLNIVGAVILVMVGIIGIVGGVIGSFEKKEQ